MFMMNPKVLSNSHFLPDRMLEFHAAANRTINDHIPEYDDHFFSSSFMEAGTRALSAGTVPDPERFSTGLDSVYDMANVAGYPIKHARSHEYRLPLQLKHLQQTVSQIMDDQFSRCPLAYYKHAILFYSHSVLKKSDVQRTPNWHRDSPKSSRDALKYYGVVSDDIPAHIYITSDCAPTTVQAKPLTNRFNMFSGADPELPVREGMVRQMEPYEISLINSAVWHRGMPMTKDGLRNFLAVMFVPTVMLEEALCQGNSLKKGFQP